jgi:hypothetical protein
MLGMDGQVQNMRFVLHHPKTEITHDFPGGDFLGQKGSGKGGK